MARIHSLGLHDLISEWDKWDEGGKNLAGIRALCLEDRFYLLVRICGRKDMLHPWILARCREVEREPDGYLDLWAREHYKSTIITYGGVMQEVLRDPEITVGIFSHTKPIANAFLAQIKREFESNTVLQAIFPDILYKEPEKEAPAGTWSLQTGIAVRRASNPKEMTIEAHGLVDGQPISKHFKLMVYDDVVTREAVNTPEQVAKTTESWELSDNLGSVGGRKWHVGTRYSYADTYEAIIKRGAVRVRLHPATNDGLMDGEPVLLEKQDWERRKIAQGEATIACQMLQNPLAGQQKMFDVADLRSYEVRPETLSVYVLVDPARSKKKESADTAVVAVGVDYAGNKFLLDGFAHKMDLQERWARTREMYVKWKRQPGIQGVKVGYEAYGAQADLDYFRERMATQGPSFPIEELAWPREGDASKVDRVQRLGPDFRTHRFYVPYPTDPVRLTAVQQKMISQGYDYRVSQRIRRKDSEGKAYDLTEIFKIQVHYFPFGGKKDVIDAVARIYDMDPRPPRLIDESRLEPEFT